MGKGFLKVQLFSADDAMPVGLVDLKITACRKTSGELLYNLKADENGNSITVEIEAPPKEYSLEPGSPNQPFYCCCVEIPASYGFQRVIIRDVQIFEGCTAILPVRLHPCPPNDPETPDEIIIPREHGIDASDHGNEPFPDVWPVSEAQDMVGQSAEFSGHVEAMQFPLANEVQIPEFITVHLGRPNTPARNVRVPFIDYIKNVACSEIYPTWHVSALHANIHAQISFALNRIFTQWYRSRGFTFDITNSTTCVKK